MSDIKNTNGSSKYMARINAIKKFIGESKIKPMNFMKCNCDHYITNNITVFKEMSDEAIYRTDNNRILFITHDTKNDILYIEYIEPENEFYIIREFNLGQGMSYCISRVLFADDGGTN